MRVVRGTIVRLVKRHAIINAGGSVLNVTLRAPKRQRSLASSQSGPSAGDSVKVEVEIDDDGSLDATDGRRDRRPGRHDSRLGRRAGGARQVPSSRRSPRTSVEDRHRRRPSRAPSRPASLRTSKVGDLIELKCDLIGGLWTVREAHGEDEHDDELTATTSSSEVEVRGTLTSSPRTATLVTVTPTAPRVRGVRARSPTGISLARFAGGDLVKMECVKLGEVLTLKEIEKKGSSGDDVERRR